LLEQRTSLKNLQNHFRMKKYFGLITTVVLGTMISCAPAQKESKSEPIQQQNQVPQTLLSADSAAVISSVPEAVPAAVTTSAQPAIVNANTTPPELNPPHGQPFHRCEIPVGSPLNAAAAPAATAKPAAPVVARTGTAPTLENAARLNNPQANNPAAPPVANANAEKPKLNPPHGQPFHRCDIAVGSPLP
jgi:hypothetical protein